MARVVEILAILAAIVIGALIILFGIPRINASTIFPSVSQLEQSLWLSQNAPLPKQVLANGHLWQPRYERGRDLGNGHYTAQLYLELLR